MTKALIAILIIAVVAFCGWGIFAYWEKINEQRDSVEQEEATRNITPERLSGLPYELQDSLNAAEQQGATALGNWLKIYGRRVEDPRKAWIELDYAVLVRHSNPAEARRVFAEVKRRTPPSSPIWPRIQELSASLE